jgi:hypothetical protein
MKALILVTLLCCIVAIKANLRIVTCPGKRPITIQKFELDGCTSYPCKLPRGTNATLRYTFLSSRRINQLKLKVAGLIGGSEVPFAIQDDDHCNVAVVHGGKCPLARNKQYKYAFSMPILQQYPKVSLVIKYEIVDLAGASLLCLTFPAQII